MTPKVGSLFDGSGGFPLAGSLCGIEPVWAAEIYPYPIAVTKSRFPKMKHLGNICNINGAEIEPVDIICAGSPCQDFSVAGLRKGLKHEENGDEETTRSGLFMEFIRIIKEMRSATNGRYPTFALWENVPGVFSSNQCEDFLIVLEELIKIAEPTAKVPPVPKGGWAYSDIYLGDGWSLAYRVFDAQYWGVPQRRRRIHLVVDFRGGRAGKVLFKRQGLRGYFAESGEAWQGVAGDAEDRSVAADREGNSVIPINTMLATRHNALGRGTGFGIGEQGDPQFTISAAHSHAVVYAIDQQGGKGGANYAENVMPTLCSDSHGTPHAVAFCQNQRDEVRNLGNVAGALAAERGTHQQTFVAEKIVLDDQGGSQINVRTDGKAPTIRAEMHGNVPCVMEAAGFKDLNSAKARSDAYAMECSPTLSANKHDASVCIEEQFLFENHSQDTRYKGPLDVCPMLPAQLGTGGNNTPFVVEQRVFRKGTRPHSADEAQKWEPADAANTLNTIDRPATAYCIGNGQADQTKLSEKVGTLDCMHDQKAVLIAIDREPQAVCHKQEVRYIVRRLTPTECARLQGFPDKWGHPDPKTELTDEEYAFWTEVRATHAVINGKEPKTYSREQILKWYNGLHTDSAEYKMWGNGIALPPALYCMQGMAEELKKEEHND